MSEQIALLTHSFEVHLVYASLVWLAAWLLTSFSRASATTKYWIWVATTLNFILPLSAVVNAFWSPHGGVSRSAPATALLAAWLVGVIVMVTRLGLRIHADGRVQEASTTFVLDGVPVKFAGSGQVPAVGGVLRSHIALPAGIERVLTERELDAVLTHELTHARRGDNLMRLVHEVALCLLWFHPLVWITGSRLALYRELSCDESVIANSRGTELVSALAKLACADDKLLQATASSFISDRLALLTAPQPHRTRIAANTLLAVMFVVVLVAGVSATAAQTSGDFRLVAVASAQCPVEIPGGH